MKIEDRIEELERRVRELEARPIAYPPVYVPYPVYPPVYPAPFYVPPMTWWSGVGVGQIGACGSAQVCGGLISFQNGVCVPTGATTITYSDANVPYTLTCSASN